MAVLRVALVHRHPTPLPPAAPQMGRGGACAKPRGGALKRGAEIMAQGRGSGRGGWSREGQWSEYHAESGLIQPLMGKRVGPGCRLRAQGSERVGDRGVASSTSTCPLGPCILALLGCPATRGYGFEFVLSGIKLKVVVSRALPSSCQEAAALCRKRPE